LEDCLGKDRPLAFLSGPAFASEIAEGLVTAVTIASHDRELANDLMELLASTNFRALYSPDVVGVEIGGAVKNVIAIAAGERERERERERRREREYRGGGG
jgi:glycerol-3-phosphate dehydrogenase